MLKELLLQVVTVLCRELPKAPERGICQWPVSVDKFSRRPLFAIQGAGYQLSVGDELWHADLLALWLPYDG